jgi:hypothetical protein
MRKAMTAICASLLALVASSVGNAAEIRILSDGKTEGLPAPAIILVKGVLKNGDDVKFQQTTSFAQSALVYLESPGGVIGPAMNIGLAINDRGFETAVADGADCTSACALAWLGGNPRRMGEGAHIGFHSTQSAKDDAAETAAGNALVGYYLHQLGLSTDAVIFVMKATPQSMTYLAEHDALASDIHFNALTRAQAERYRDTLVNLHVGPNSSGARVSSADPLPADVRVVAGRQTPLTIGPAAIEHSVQASRVDEVLLQATRRASSGDVVGARDMLSKFATPTDTKSAARIAFALAETYDPNMLAAWGIIEVPSDAPLARRLYRQAMEHEPLAAKAWDRLAALGNY